MLYSQIKLIKSIPFEIELPARIPISVDDLTLEHLNAELQKGYDSVQSGRVYSADKVDSVLSGIKLGEVRQGFSHSI